MKHAVLFLLLGGLMCHLAIKQGNWCYLMLWPSISCFLLSIGYLGYGAQVFGKRPDGAIPIWSKVLHGPYRLYALCVWRLLCILIRENPTDKISDDLVLGRRLQAHELPEGVANYVDLTAELEDPVEIRGSASYLTLPILDGSVPPADALHSFISQLRPGVTFVHCAQGHGRTGLFAMAYLFQKGRIRSFDEGWALLKKGRPGVFLNSRQKRFIRDYLLNDWH